MNVSLVAIAVAMALEERQYVHQTALEERQYVRQAAQEASNWNKPKKASFASRLTGFVKSILK